MSAVTEARLRALKVSKWCARLLVAGAFALSAVALTELATDAHIPWWLAWIWPVVIDGSIYQASTAVMALAGRDEQEAKDARRWFQWVIAGGVAVSVAANGLHAWTTIGNSLTWWQIGAVAIVPPMLLLVATHGVTILAGLDNITADVEQHQADEPVRPATEDANAAAEPVTAEPEASPEPEQDPVPGLLPGVEQQMQEIAAVRRYRRPASAGQRDPARVLTAKRLAEQETPVEVIAERLEVSTRTVRRYLKAEIPEVSEQVEAEVIEIEQRPHLVAIESGEVVNG
ncbi:DUF2637 domain-containing protein [Nocardia testacea]|uniref:DUF2637 domain-containing protein n=2 Tax=Nocardia testacea TaxID=248551 RepID=UPI003A8C5970